MVRMVGLSNSGESLWETPGSASQAATGVVARSVKVLLVSRDVSDLDQALRTLTPRTIYARNPWTSLLPALHVAVRSPLASPGAPRARVRVLPLIDPALPGGCSPPSP